MTEESVERTLGKLLANVESLSEKFDAFEEKSDRSRAGMHERIDKLNDKVGSVEKDVVAVKKDVKDMKPVTDKVQRWELMGIGALAVTGITFAAIGVTFSDFIRRAISAIIGH